VFLINLLRFRNLEIQRTSDLVEVDCDEEKTSDSAGVFESIRVINQAIKQEMKEEMKRLGLTDDDIRYVFKIDND
jgi:hypothetical protein